MAAAARALADRIFGALILPRCAGRTERAEVQTPFRPVVPRGTRQQVSSQHAVVMLLTMGGEMCGATGVLRAARRALGCAAVRALLQRTAHVAHKESPSTMGGSHSRDVCSLGMSCAHEACCATTSDVTRVQI